MTYKRYLFTAEQISAGIWKQLRIKISPQSVRDHRNGKRANPKTIAAIEAGTLRCATDELIKANKKSRKEAA